MSDTIDVTLPALKGDYTRRISIGDLAGAATVLAQIDAILGHSNWPWPRSAADLARLAADTAHVGSLPPRSSFTLPDTTDRRGYTPRARRARRA